MNKKLLCILITVVMVFTMIPFMAFATQVEYVYISASHDGEFISDSNGNAMAYKAVALDELAAIDLDSYGLSDYIYDKDGDGNYDITALHLYIYTHQKVLGLDWNDVNISGGAGSIYFAGGLFGFEDENLRYNYNGAYPADENGWGFTADQIVLSEGDFFEVAHYSDWNFYADSAYGFHYFTNENDEIGISYEAEAGTDLTLKLIRVGGGMGMGDSQTNVGGYTVFYGQTVGTATGSVTTEDDGTFKVNFPTAGTWYVWCNGDYGVDSAAGAIVSSPASAKITISSEDSETPREPQDVSAVLNATMAEMANTVTAPAFGTNAGEWTVLSLARGEYYAKDNVYFTDYYDRIVETVNTTAASVNMNGALHKNKSTDNSRLIVALSSIGRDATAVGDWNLVEAYSANGFNWIKKQGINGAIWALIALDSNDYETTDTTIRQQCIDFILGKQLEDGGWTLSGTVSDPDITGMTLQALYNYRDQEAVSTACAEAITCLSEMQLDNGGFSYGTSETSESASQVIVALTTWGINPDTDSRFVKNNKSVVDALLDYYIESEAMFEHQAGAGSNDMATDQACYALVAYNRFMNSKTALYDMSDVTFDEKGEITAGTPKATLGVPTEITDDIGSTFNATITIDQWDNNAGYKLVDFIMNVPEGLSVASVTAGNRLSGGAVNHNLEADTGKLRVVYFDANNHSDLTISGNSFPAQLFTITFRVDSANAGDKLSVNIEGMSIKLSSDSTDENAMITVDVTKASGTVNVIQGVSYSAVCLYEGDDVDLIPSSKKAVAVSVVGIEKATKLTYSDGTNEYEFKYSAEISEKTGIDAYVAIVDASVDMTQFANKVNFTLAEDEASQITFGDSNVDGVVNAQDALSAVDTWLRKTDAPTDDEILALNVNSDSRINTFDALGIVETYVDGSEYLVVTKAANLATNN